MERGFEESHIRRRRCSWDAATYWKETQTMAFWAKRNCAPLHCHELHIAALQTGGFEWILYLLLVGALSWYSFLRHSQKQHHELRECVCVRISSQSRIKGFHVHHNLGRNKLLGCIVHTGGIHYLRKNIYSLVHSNGSVAIFSGRLISERFYGSAKINCNSITHLPTT